MLIPYLIWHYYFNDMVPMADKGGWRDLPVLDRLRSGSYATVSHWALGNEHMASALAVSPMASP